MKRIIFSLLLLCGITSACLARISATGCLIISEKKVYTVLGAQGIYNRTATSVSASYCNWTPTTGAACNVCSVNLNGGGNCGGTLIAGVQNSFVEMCPLDDWIGYLVVLAGALGFFMLRPAKNKAIIA